VKERKKVCGGEKQSEGVLVFFFKKKKKKKKKGGGGPRLLQVTSDYDPMRCGVTQETF